MDRRQARRAKLLGYLLATLGALVALLAAGC